MLFSSAGALAIGFVLSSFVPFLAFAASLMVAIAAGAGIAIAQGRPVAETALVALAILIACQLGYGMGLVVAAAIERARRPLRSGRTDDGADQLRHERK